MRFPNDIQIGSGLGQKVFVKLNKDDFAVLSAELNGLQGNLTLMTPNVCCL